MQLFCFSMMTWLECSSVISAHCNLYLPGSSNSADENVGFRRLISQRIRNGIITVMELNLRAFQQVVPDNGLTDCEDNVLRLDRNRVVFVVLRVEAICLRVDDRQAFLEHDRFDELLS